jgi:hypothetical protein
MPLTPLEAARKRFPKSHPDYHRQIAIRYWTRFVPDDEAVPAILNGYSSPSHAMTAGQIPKTNKIREWPK